MQNECSWCQDIGVSEGRTGFIRGKRKACRDQKEGRGLESVVLDDRCKQASCGTVLADRFTPVGEFQDDSCGDVQEAQGSSKHDFRYS